MNKQDYKDAQDRTTGEGSHVSPEAPKQLDSANGFALTLFVLAVILLLGLIGAVSAWGVDKVFLMLGIG